MKKYQTLLFTTFLALGSYTVVAQDCVISKTKEIEAEVAEIPGETMGQKLESLLFWSQEEKERRFSMMHQIFPSIPVSTGNRTTALEKEKPITPKWEDGTTLSSYMKDHKIQGVIVLQNNKVVLEQYAEGRSKKTLWTSYSVAKSVSSMLVGVALKEGDIESLDDPLKKYITELKGHDYGDVSVRELLTMTSGIDWNEDYEDPNSDVAQMYQSPCEGTEAHIMSYMKPLEALHEGGTHWNYSTGETDMVGILVQKATGKSLASYLSEKIWKPYGMEACAYWLADECSNLNIGGSGLSASLRDYARLGTFILNEGKINGQSILAKAYLNKATSLLYPVDEEGNGYGYLWWSFEDGSYAAFGIFGQMLYINPNKNIVIAQMAAWPKAGSEKLAKNRQAFIAAVLRVMNN